MAVEVTLTPQRSDALRQSAKWSTGSTGFCSWERLAVELRKAGVISQDEDITGFRLEDAGLQLELRRRDVADR